MLLGNKKDGRRFMKLLINGSSVARGPNTWPYLLQQRLKSNLVNLSQAGAGNHYICDTTIDELSKRSYDLVIVMWADFRRIDIKVKNIEYFDDTIYTSKFQKTMNDWPEKIVYPINDQDYVDNNWLFGCGYLNNEKGKLAEFFDPIYTHTDIENQYYMAYMKIVALQSFLKSINQPYAFCGVRQFSKIGRFESIYNLLDFDRIINDLTPHDFANKFDSWDQDGLHPGILAHQLFTDHLEQFLQTKELLSNGH